MSSTALLRVLLDGERLGAANMAVDDSLLEGSSAHEYTMRWYAWARPTVSLGYAQRWREGFDPCFAGRFGVDLVRRRTGGRAVLHADELTYALTGPAARGPFAGGVLPTYQVIAEGLVVGLRRLGADVCLERARGRRDRAAPGACFAARALHEVVGDGRKLLGSAQRRAAGRVLQHGSLPLGPPDPRLWGVLGSTGAGAARDSVGLYELLVGRPGRRAIASTLSQAVAEALTLTPMMGALSRAERVAAVRHLKLYRDRRHTLRR
ncbi:MAG TPA: hypothetical protein QGG47_04030 [Acidobacteriota bacterium]|nr:hypothetical protein [Acidobacteriota bacterium]